MFIRVIIKFKWYYSFAPRSLLTQDWKIRFEDRRRKGNTSDCDVYLSFLFFFLFLQLCTYVNWEIIGTNSVVLSAPLIVSLHILVRTGLYILQASTIRCIYRALPCVCTFAAVVRYIMHIYIQTMNTYVATDRLYCFGSESTMDVSHHYYYFFQSFVVCIILYLIFKLLYFVNFFTHLTHSSFTTVAKIVGFLLHYIITLHHHSLTVIVSRCYYRTHFFSCFFSLSPYHYLRHRTRTLET